MGKVFYVFSVLNFLLVTCTAEKAMETMVATWEGVVIAESGNCVVVEGNQYFPADSIKMEYFEKSDTTTVCGWKGTANYYNVRVNGKVNKDAAWYYAEPKAAAENIKGRVAFWKGVVVKKSPNAEL
ncbi:uncharacterized protein LOC110861097 [Folsomia candida]|uniref:uncharacterized protein LOC110861097 n=1 Tax=Folsomia candida TaxID=158441 RepID=UPI000B8FFA60|nr:uncharacterized protein LOC110861097 [Folsomia candida]